MIIELSSKPLSRDEYAQRGAELKKLRAMQELAANEKVAMVYSSITSPDDLIPVISAEKENCFKIALRYTKGDRDAADDIYQLALYHAYLHLKNGRPYVVPRKAVERIQLDDSQAVNPKAHEIIVKNPAAWLHTIVRNTGYNEYLRVTRTIKWR